MVGVWPTSHDVTGRSWTMAWRRWGTTPPWMAPSIGSWRTHGGRSGVRRGTSAWSVMWKTRRGSAASPWRRPIPSRPQPTQSMLVSMTSSEAWISHRLSNWPPKPQYAWPGHYRKGKRNKQSIVMHPSHILVALLNCHTCTAVSTDLYLNGLHYISCLFFLWNLTRILNN